MILYNFASRNRPERLIKTLEAIKEKSNLPLYYVVLLKLDSDDESVNNRAFLDRLDDLNMPISIAWGTSKNKIHAINRGIYEFNEEHPLGKKWKVLINMSDDMMPVMQGFDEKIIDVIGQLGGYTMPIFLHTNDGHVGDKLCTLSIMTRRYFDIDEYVYNPSYTSLWSDNEAMEVAKMRNMWHYDPHVYFEHQHPAWGFAQNMDAGYAHTESFYHTDQKVYIERKSHNFYEPKHRATNELFTE